MLLTVFEFPSESARSSIIHAFSGSSHECVSVESAFTGWPRVLKVLKCFKVLLKVLHKVLMS